jgi:hypothetical protein
VIGQLAISSQFGREAVRILMSHSIVARSARHSRSSPLLFVQNRVALRVNGGPKVCAQSHRSQRHLLHNTTSSTACLVSLSFFSNEEGVEGESPPARVKRALCAERGAHPFAIFREERSRCVNVAECFFNRQAAHSARRNA